MNETIKVTHENYFEDTGHMSVSRFKRFLKCEIGAMAEWKSTSDALLFGSYVDAYVEGTLEKFKQDHPELISTRGPTKGKLKAAFSQADKICEFIDNDEVIQQFLSGKKQQIMEGEIEGVPFKIMMDSYSEGIAISDLKVMRTVTNRDGEYYDFITQWGYQYQGACYQEIVRQVTGETLPFFLVVVTKENPINSIVVQIPQEDLDFALETVKDNIQKYYGVLQGRDFARGCGKCKTCVANRKTTPIISLEDLQIGGDING